MAERAMRAFDVKGDLPGTMLATFDPVIQVEDLTEHEYFWLRRGRSWSVTVSQGAVAAQNAVVELQAATTAPDTVAIIDALLVTNIDAALRTYRFGLGTKQLVAVAQTPVATDDRHLGQTSAYKAFAGNLVYAANNQAALITPGTSTVLVRFTPQPYVLTGGPAGSSCFAVFMDDLNIALRTTIFFRERQILAAER
ncbi:MAG: hypothetical protein ACRDLY_15905 [Thermoleophilaceae bacterium]